MHKILFIFFGFLWIGSTAQLDINNSTWLTENDVVLKINNSRVNLTEIDYISSYEIKGDTLHFKHDFSHVMEVTVGGKILDRKDFELPDSYFKIISNHNDSLLLIAINPTAVHMVNQVTHKFNYHLSEKEAIQWEKTGKKPNNLSRNIDTCIQFYHIRTITKQKQISKISFSAVIYGWTEIFYKDIIINSDLKYVSRTITQDYKDKNHCEYLYYSGDLDSSVFSNIEKHFNQSNLPDTATITYNTRYSSHDTNFSLDIINDAGKISINGNKTSLPDLVKDFINSIDWHLPNGEDDHGKIMQEFPLSKFKIN